MILHLMYRADLNTNTDYKICLFYASGTNTVTNNCYKWKNSYDSYIGQLSVSGGLQRRLDWRN